MSRFKEVGLSWQGREYVVPADRVMGLIAAVEEHITIEDLAAKGVKRAKLSQAFAAALRYAGAPLVDEEEIYLSLFGGNALNGTTKTIYMLLAMMIPPEHLQQKSPPPKKPRAARKKKASAKAPSKRGT